MTAYSRAELLAVIGGQIRNGLRAMHARRWYTPGLDDGDLAGEAWVVALEAIPRWRGTDPAAYFRPIVRLAMAGAAGRWRAHLHVPSHQRLPALPARVGEVPDRAGPDPRPEIEARITVARAAATLTPHTRSLALAAAGVDGAPWRSLETIGRDHGVSKSAAHQAHKRFAARLREMAA